MVTWRNFTVFVVSWAFLSLLYRRSGCTARRGAAVTSRCQVSFVNKWTENECFQSENTVDCCIVALSDWFSLSSLLSLPHMNEWTCEHISSPPPSLSSFGLHDDAIFQKKKKNSTYTVYLKNKILWWQWRQVEVVLYEGALSLRWNFANTVWGIDVWRGKQCLGLYSSKFCELYEGLYLH